ncbi:uncharacterized protein [Procambarus clarkii]|uniref:uncharacterized protein n=1 Tax=Procambarus clarkii TaxID=6728 RepID=UPI0037435135
MAWLVAAVIVITTTLCRVTKVAANLPSSFEDLHDAVPEGQEGRFFINYDQSTAFNTSVAFTIPLFSFTLPGAGEFTAAGLSSQSFGGLAFIALFLLGGLGVAIYTTSHGSFGRQNDDAEYNQEAPLTRLVLQSVMGLPNVVDTRSCSSLAICSAYADRERYGLLAWLLRFLVSYSPDTPEDQLTEFQKAARYGQEDREDCQYEYPCLVQPLDLLLYIYDYWKGVE